MGYHHTIGLGGIGLGILLLAGHYLTIFRKQGTLPTRAGTKPPKITKITKITKGQFRFLTAILIIVLVGAATFVGSSYLQSPQPSGSQPSHTTTTYAITTHTTSSQFITSYRPNQATTSVTSASTTSLVSRSSSSSGTVIGKTSTSTFSSTTSTSPVACGGVPTSLDGSVIAYNESGSSGTVLLTTSKSPDAIMVYITTEGNLSSNSSAPPSVVKLNDGTGTLTFHRRIALQTPILNNEGVKISEEEWYAMASAPLSNDIIRVDLLYGTEAFSIIAFGVAGVSLTSPFDSNSAVPVAVAGSTTGTISASISTNCSNEIIIGGAAMASFSPQTGTGFTLIQTDNGQSAGPDPIAEFELVASPQSSLEVTFANQNLAGTQTWIVIADALD